MNPEKILTRYITKSRTYRDRFFKNELTLAKKVSPLSAVMIGSLWRFMGGKNLRGALTYYSYRLFGGRNEASILKASLIVELIHAYLLIHDDIIDQDNLRRGHLTLHRQYEKLIRLKASKKNKKNPQHFGLSLALIVGDLAPHLANILLFDSNFEPKVIISFLKEVSRTVINTAYGQALDVLYENDPHLTLAKILEVHRLKTAQYTIVGPLKYGAVLAGVNPHSASFRALEKFGLPVGMAFQLRDDELGLFSSEKELGKPVDSDLKEGKNTLLFQKAFEKSTPQQLKFLRYAHGNQNLSKNDVEKVRRIVIESGAWGYSKKLSRQLSQEGKKYIPKITKDKHFQNLLNLTADYVIERNH